MVKWKNWQTREYLELTKRVHEEFQSMRRVLESAHGPMNDTRWCAIQIDSLDPRRVLETTDTRNLQHAKSLWVYWILMAALGPPTISGTHCALRDRDGLRELYQSRAGPVPSQRTMSKFLWRMAENAGNIREWLLEELNIDTTIRMSPERRRLADAADAGIMVLELHRDLVMNGENIGEELQEKVEAMRLFAGEAKVPGTTMEQTAQLARIRERITGGRQLAPDLEDRLSELANTIMVRRETPAEERAEPEPNESDGEERLPD